MFCLRKLVHFAYHPQVNDHDFLSQNFREFVAWEDGKAFSATVKTSPKVSGSFRVTFLVPFVSLPLPKFLHAASGSVRETYATRESLDGLVLRQDPADRDLFSMSHLVQGLHERAFDMV